MTKSYKLIKEEFDRAMEEIQDLEERRIIRDRSFEGQWKRKGSKSDQHGAYLLSLKTKFPDKWRLGREKGLPAAGMKPFDVLNRGKSFNDSWCSRMQQDRNIQKRLMKQSQDLTAQVMAVKKINSPVLAYAMGFLQGVVEHREALNEIINNTTFIADYLNDFSHVPFNSIDGECMEYSLGRTGPPYYRKKMNELNDKIHHPLARALSAQAEKILKVVDQEPSEPESPPKEKAPAAEPAPTAAPEGVSDEDSEWAM